eukprot:g9772.t1
MVTGSCRCCFPQVLLSTQSFEEEVDRRDRWGRTALHLAVEQHHSEVARRTWRIWEVLWRFQHQRRPRKACRTASAFMTTLLSKATTIRVLKLLGAMAEPLILMVAEKPSIAATLTEALCPPQNGAQKRKGVSPSSPVHEYRGSFMGHLDLGSYCSLYNRRNEEDGSCYF